MKKILVVGALLAVTAFGCGGDDAKSHDEMVNQISKESEVDKETAECIVSALEDADGVDLQAMFKKDDPADLTAEETSALMDATLSCVDVEDVLDEG